MVGGGADFPQRLISSFLCLYCYFKVASLLYTYVYLCVSLYIHVHLSFVLLNLKISALHVILYFSLDKSYLILNIARKFLKTKQYFRCFLFFGDMSSNLNCCYAH